MEKISYENLFGADLAKRVGSREDRLDVKLKSFAPKRDEEGATAVTVGGYYGQYVDIDGTSASSDHDLIVKYRESAAQPECEQAINDIVDAAIVSNDDSTPVDINMQDLEMPTSIKKQIAEEFERVCRLYRFNRKGSDIFREWYVDGRAYFHVITNEGNMKSGIRELRQINPLHLRKVKEIKKILDPKTKIKIPKTVAEYYIYSEEGVNAGNSLISGGAMAASQTSGVKIATDAIISCPSGIFDSSNEKVISHLHKAMKLVNQLRMMEDALVIYRLSRAPERRIFYIDVGNLPKGKAEEYVQSVMAKYRNKLVYDSNTGDIKDDTRHMSMLEDFYMPRREGGRGTEITTLPGGENLGQIDDVVFFQRKLYKALNVPIGRLDPETQYTFGRASEVSRDEVKFQKFVNRLRKSFSFLLLDALRIQLILKGIVKQSEWNQIEDSVSIDYIEDNYFSELKEFEILRERIETLNTLGEFVGKYYSEKWVRNNILRQTDEDIERIDKEISDEPDETDEFGEFDSKPSKEEPPTEKPADDNVDESRMVIENEEREQEIKEAQLKMINSMTKILDE